MLMRHLYCPQKVHTPHTLSTPPNTPFNERPYTLRYTPSYTIAHTSHPFSHALSNIPTHIFYHADNPSPSPSPSCPSPSCPSPSPPSCPSPLPPNAPPSPSCLNHTGIDTTSTTSSNTGLLGHTGTSPGSSSSNASAVEGLGQGAEADFLGGLSFDFLSSFSQLGTPQLGGASQLGGSSSSSSSSSSNIAQLGLSTSSSRPLGIGMGSSPGLVRVPPCSQ